MSVTLPFKVWTTRLPGGEARAFLLDELGVPDSYSTLFITATLRNAGRALATEVAALNAINILYWHCAKHRIDLGVRFSEAKFLTSWEIEAMRASVQRNFGARQKAFEKVVQLGRGKKGHTYRGQVVEPGTQYGRLTYIASYLEWLAYERSARSTRSRLQEIEAMTLNIRAIRPARASQGDDSDKRRFTHRQNDILNEIIEPSSSSNPFEVGVQLRNKLIVYLLRSLGKRRGEVLNIRLGDIKRQDHRIDIVRRADDASDTRRAQPLVKTLEHSIPLYPEMEQLIDDYLVVRRSVPGALRHPYLLVTHQEGPTQGQPMTISALNKIFVVLKASDPELKNLHPHLLRHFHGDMMAQMQQDNPQTKNGSETDRRTRNTLAGRRPDSAVDATYTARAIARKAAEVSKQVQRQLMGAGTSERKK